MWWNNSLLILAVWGLWAAMTPCDPNRTWQVQLMVKPRRRLIEMKWRKRRHGLKRDFESSSNQPDWKGSSHPSVYIYIHIHWLKRIRLRPILPVFSTQKKIKTHQHSSTSPAHPNPACLPAPPLPLQPWRHTELGPEINHSRRWGW